MKKSTKILLGALGLAGAGVVVASLAGLYGDGTNLHLYRDRDEYMAAEELPVGSNMVIVGYDPGHPQAATVEVLLAELAGRYPEIHFVGLPRDVAIDSVGMTFIQDGWGGVASGGSGGGAFEAVWYGKADKVEISDDLNAAVAALAAADFQPTDGTDSLPLPDAGTDSVPIS